LEAFAREVPTQPGFTPSAGELAECTRSVFPDSESFDPERDTELEPPSNRSERRFRHLIDSFHDGIAIARDGRLLYVNDALVEMLGYESRADLLRMSPSLLLATHVEPSGLAEAVEAFLEVVRGDSPRREDERTLVTRSGRRMVAHFFHDQIAFDQAPAVMTTLRDVTEAREIRHHLQRADRLASLGTLAAGVAHEINNPLAYVISNLAYCMEKLELLHEQLSLWQLVSGDSAPCAAMREVVEPMRHALGDASDGAGRVAHIVRDLKSMTRDDDELIGPVDLENVIDCALKLAENEIRYRATLRREFSPSTTVHGNETRLVQVFLNLLVNAAQAIESGTSDTNFITIRTQRRDDDSVLVEIEDTGRGIPQDVLDRIFDPFFTTKPVGVGTGLGLSICHGLVYSMGGRLAVHSEVGKGTRVSVELRAEPERAPKSIRPGSVRPPPRARLLIVDDEPLILRSLGRVLSRFHDVELAASGQDGLTRIRGGERYDLIVCDLMMPELTGMDFHAALSREAPECAERVVFLTGGAFTERARTYLETVQNPTLEKPVQPALLRALLDQMLRTHGAA
jgi:PAS domain S-box-containing protein